MAYKLVRSNPGYSILINIENSSRFKENFDTLVTSLLILKSKDTKLYISLLESTSISILGNYLNLVLEVVLLIKAYFYNLYFSRIIIFNIGYSK